jgi:predicted nucleic acid-binding protein
MKIVVDTSSLLSLEFMNILDDTSSIAEVYTTSIVIEELKEISSFNDEKSEIARRVLRLVQDGKITSLQVKNGLFSKFLSRNVDSGEASCLALCISEKIPLLITDDADAAYYLGRIASQNKIKIRICVAVLIELIKSKKISKSAAKNKVEELIKKRGWEGGVLEVLAKKYLE